MATPLSVLSAGAPAISPSKEEQFAQLQIILCDYLGVGERLYVL